MIFDRGGNDDLCSRSDSCFRSPSAMGCARIKHVALMFHSHCLSTFSPPTYGSHGSLFDDPPEAIRMNDFGRGGSGGEDNFRSRSGSMVSLTEREAAMLAGEDGEDDEICSQFTESSQEYMDDVSIRGISPSPLDMPSPMHIRSSSNSASVMDLISDESKHNLSRSYESERDHKEETPSSSSSATNSLKRPLPGGGRHRRRSSLLLSSASSIDEDDDDEEEDDVATFHRPLLMNGGASSHSKHFGNIPMSNGHSSGE